MTPFVTLYFHFQSGCPACHAAMPELEKWRKKGRYLFPVVKVNVGLKDWETGG